MPIEFRSPKYIDVPSLAAREVNLTLDGAVGKASHADWDAGTAVDKWADVEGVAYKIGEEVGPRIPYVIVATGQSNAATTRTFSWTPPSNLYVWNNTVGTEGSVGTAYAAPSGTVISFPLAYAAYIAERFPRLDVHLVIEAFGGRSLDHWTNGVAFNFDTGTGTPPGTGEVRLNHATPASATALYANVIDADGFNRLDAFFFASPAPWVRIEKADNPAIYREYTPNSWTDNTTYWTVDLTYVGSAGTLNDGDAVRLRIGPDVFAELEANIPDALTEAGATQVDHLVWWQGEGDFTPQPYYYAAEWEEMFFDRMVAAGLLPDGVPITIMGTVQSNINGNTAYDRLSYELQRVVHNAPDSRIFYNPASDFPVGFWQDGVLLQHMTADGYWGAGRAAATAFINGGGRSIAQGMVSDPVTGRPMFIDGSRAEPATGFVRDDDLGFYNGGSGVMGIAADGMEMVRYAADAVAAFYYIGKSRGTAASPAAVVQNDQALNIDALAQASASARVSASRDQVTIIEATPGAAAMGARRRFLLCPEGSVTLTAILELDHTGGARVFPALATPAGGTAGKGLSFGSAGPGIFFGSGAPTLSAAKGSIYLRTDGSSTSTRAYINTDGGTTWTNVTTAA